MINLLLVAIGGFFGAILRAIISNQYNNKYSLQHLGTFLVNSIGSFLLGFILNLHIQSGFNLLFGVGFLGSFTTFSTFKVENIKLLQSKKRKKFMVYLTMSYLLGIGLAGLGFWLARLI